MPIKLRKCKLFCFHSAQIWSRSSGSSYGFGEEGTSGPCRWKRCTLLVLLTSRPFPKKNVCRILLKSLRSNEDLALALNPPKSPPCWITELSDVYVSNRVVRCWLCWDQQRTEDESGSSPVLAAGENIAPPFWLAQGDGKGGPAVIYAIACPLRLLFWMMAILVTICP